MGKHEGVRVCVFEGWRSGEEGEHFLYGCDALQSDIFSNYNLLAYGIVIQNNDTPNVKMSLLS